MQKKITLGYFLLCLIFLICTMGPLVWSFLLSITPEYEMFQNNKSFLPEHATSDNYELLFTMANRRSRLFFTSMGNSIKAVVLTLSIGLPMGTVSAYALSKMKFPGQKLIKNMLLITMAVPVFATIIPLYRIFSQRQMLDQLFWLSVVYVSSFLPVTVWLIMNYFNTIPQELEEAALVDGCSMMGMFFRIYLPMSLPILLSAGLIIFLSAWNQFQIPLILASSNATKPISIVASEFMTKDTIQYGLTSAAGLMAILPPALAALIFRRYLIDGMTGGAVKG